MRKIIYVKCSLSVVLLCLGLVTATAQYSVDYFRKYGGTGIDIGNAIDVNENLELLVVGGQSYSSNGYLSQNLGGSDYWIMQIDADGDTTWTRSLGGGDNDDINDIHFLDDRIVAFGTTWSNNEGDVPEHTGNVGAWLVTMDIAGNPGLSRVYSGSLGERGIDLEPMSDGGYVLLVQSSSPVLEGDNNHGMFDTWIARVSSTGNIQWSQFFGGGEIEVPTRLIRVTGGLVVIGSTASDDGDITENKGGYDYWIQRIDLSGNLIWEKSFGGSGDDLANDGILLNDGTILITGESNSTDGDRSMAYGSTDAWIINIDTDGNLLWERTYGGTDEDYGQQLLELEDHIALVAHSESSDLDLGGNKGRQDVWVAYLNPNGGIHQQMNYGGSLDDFAGMTGVEWNGLAFFVGSSLSIDGNFAISGYGNRDLWLMRTSIDTVPCADNYECFPFEDVNFAVLEPESDGPVLCVNGCNAGADPGPFGPSGCTNFNGAPAAWFKIKTDADAEAMTLQVYSPEFNTPQILVMLGTNCQNFTPVNCDYGTEGLVNIINMQVMPNTTYYVVIGDDDGLEGSFDLCVSVLDIEFCNKQQSLYVNATSLGSPLTGPFQPGEEVQICYEVNVWDKVDCNGLQGILPTFGTGWDSLSFNSEGKPIQIDTLLEPVSQNGDWDWWELGTVHYNFTNPVFGYSGGQTMPTGWYFVNYDDAPPNDNPDQSIGDLSDCEPDNDAMWKVCFTLKTREECEENLDCSVTFKTFADGELGANISQSCQNDPPVKINRTLNCCIDPRIEPIADRTICSGDTMIVSFESNLNPPVTYAWGVNVMGNISGAAPGVSNNIIFHVLSNGDNTPGTVTYTVQASTSMCETAFTDFTITVLPEPSANMSRTGPAVICSGESAEVRFDFIGQGPFVATYAINGVPQPPILSETQSTTIGIPLTEDAFISFIEFHDGGNCPGDPNGAFQITVLPLGETNLDTTICMGDSLEIGDRKFGFPGSYEVVLENASENGCDSVVHLELGVGQTYERNISATICDGESYMIGQDSYTETGLYTNTLSTQFGCDSIINLNLLVTNEIIDESNAVICAGTSIEFGGELLFMDGTYYDTVAISASCDSIYILNLNVLDVIVLIQTQIMPDTGDDSGSIMIQVAGGIPPYDYLWSNGDTTNSPKDLAVGSYMLTVTDGVGCTAEFEFFLVSGAFDLLPGFDAVWIAPNPGIRSTEFVMGVSRQEPGIRDVWMRILTTGGSIVQERQVKLTAREERIPIGIQNVPSGSYLLQLIDPDSGRSLTRRFVMQ